MKIESLPYRYLAMIFLILPMTAWSQATAIPWSSFSGGFGVSTSANTMVYSSAGEIVGTADGGNTGVRSGFLVVRMQSDFTTAVDVSEGIPASYALRQNYPNPFNPVTTLRFDLPQAAAVRLVVHDLQGHEVARLLDRRVEPGYHQVTWDGRDRNGRQLPTGVYIARLTVPGYAKSIKLLLLR